MARIGMVLENDYPADLRLEKEASALRAAGHSVHLLCLEFGVRVEHETVGPLEVTRKKLPRFVYRKLHPTTVRFPFYRALWRQWIATFVRESRIDVLHVHDLPLSRAGIEVARDREIPIVIDLHENFPAAIKEWGHEKGFLRSFLYDFELWQKYERDACRQATRVIAVVDEAVPHLIAHGIERDKIVVVTNTDRKTFGQDVVARDVSAPGEVEFLYIGGFGPHRGLEFAVEGFSRLPDEDFARLRLVGGGRSEPDIRRTIIERDITDRVSVESWVPQAQVAGEIGKSHVGVVTHRPSDHTNTTVPHKLFLYMAMGRPVIASDCTPLERVIRDAGCGIVVPFGDVEALRRAYRELLEPTTRQRMGEAARRAVVEKYNWELDSEQLRLMYAALA